ncbi:YqiA/YcfP family alpha/beta fold hydrolase [Pseudorhodoferax sp. Leaf267]|uniref:YqiA/YcfP family alpha/beta fold hydrolase n=1 Tax=Pseudorhodoferax sp. Leaf267 TaxID=1736316 RepID=UPI0006FAA59D|nr:YqiA/YcfP family alpha/beta fold hydrolase [Pseudorhodoferax sp. Leaf267]KQP14409.1 esterase [Pseudorhodoferax sp. Leaf267]
MPLTHLLYLHGFRSSPQSTKARLVAARVQARHPELVWWCPQLPPSPRQAMDELLAGIADWPRASMAVVGSSLGGFYATVIAEQTGSRAVLLNPAVHPARDLARHIGEHTAWHDPNERFFFRAAYIDELRAMEQPPKAPAAQAAMARSFAIIAKGDEVLDWREMCARYPRARVKLLEGSDHAISEFPEYVDEVFDFLLAPA